MLIDDETETYWDHITGEAVHGPLEGRSLDFWSVQVLTVEEALHRYPDLEVIRSKRSWKARILDWLMGFLGLSAFGRFVLFPPGFKASMEPSDSRFSLTERGVGLLVEGQAYFLPRSACRPGLRVTLPQGDLLVEGEDYPVLAWSDGSYPFQLHTRWYGFQASYPGCRVLALES